MEIVRFLDDMVGDPMFSLISLAFKYLFIFLIYLFIFGIMRLIYLDIRSMSGVMASDHPYLKLINRKDTLPFKMNDEYILSDEKIYIGRGNENTIVIKDPFVSNHHAQITKDEEEYFLEDFDSANGTYLNGERILDAVMLKNGDRIGFGQIEFLYVRNK
ncbi:MAG: FHA domain-containing protein [Bacillota bacterium]